MSILVVLRTPEDLLHGERRLSVGPVHIRTVKDSAFATEKVTVQENTRYLPKIS